jgi:uncharacterized protein YlzI (FlbEa/FlbD family)
MKFVELPQISGHPLYLNPMTVTGLEPLASTQQTRVHTMGGAVFQVRATAEEVQSRIEEATRVKLTNWETGPR